MFDQLPDDLKKQVLCFLNLQEKIQTSLINKSTYSLVNNEQTWQVFCTFENLPVQNDIPFKNIYLHAHGFVLTHSATSYYIVGKPIQLHVMEARHPFIRKRDDIGTNEIQNAFPTEKILSVFLTKADADLFSQSQTELYQLIPMSIPVVFQVSLQPNVVAKKKQVNVDVPGKLYYQKETHQLTFFLLKTKNILRGQNEKLGNLFILPEVTIEPSSQTVCDHNFTKTKCGII